MTDGLERSVVYEVDGERWYLNCPRFGNLLEYTVFCC